MRVSGGNPRMPKLDEQTLLSFRAELHKEAGFSSLVASAAPRLKNIASAGGVGATLGAMGGAGIGAVQQYRAARTQGDSVGRATIGSLGGALHGATRGALVGGLAGAAGGGLLNRGAGLTRMGGPIGAGARFGQRQMHAVTGMLSPKELEGVHGGAYDRVEELAKTLARGKPSAGAEKALRVTEAATGVGPGSMDLTSLPGYVGALKQHGVGKVLATSAREQFANPGVGALLVAGPALAGAGALASHNEYNNAGQGKGEQLGENIGQLAGNIAGGVMPLAGQEIAGGVLGRAGKYIGRGIDRLRGKSGAPGISPSTLEPAEGQHIPTERVTSPAAAGQQPDIGL